VRVDASAPWRGLEAIPSDASWFMRWTPDGSAITYVRRDGAARNIWMQPLSRAPATQVSFFPSGFAQDIAWSRDGRRLVTALFERATDVVLIADDSKPRSGQKR
jgi:hypothetical protein